VGSGRLEMKRRAVLLVGGVSDKLFSFAPIFRAQKIDLMGISRANDAFRMIWQYDVDTIVLDADIQDLSVSKFMSTIADVADKRRLEIFIVASDAEWDNIVNSLPDNLLPTARIRKPPDQFEILYAVKGPTQLPSEAAKPAQFADDKFNKARAMIAQSPQPKKELPQKGRLKQFAPERLLIVLAGRRFTGVVTFALENRLLKLEFNVGRMKSFLARNVKAPSLLDLALDLGLITPRARTKITKLSEARSIPVPQLLLDLNEVTGEQLNSAILFKDVRRVQSVFDSDWSDGEFRIERGATLGNEGKSIDFNLGKLVIDGLLNYYDPDRIEAFFNKHGGEPFVRNYRTPFSLRELALSGPKSDLILQVDGVKTLSDMRLGEPEKQKTKQFLYALWVVGFIRPVKREESEAQES